VANFCKSRTDYVQIMCVMLYRCL